MSDGPMFLSRSDEEKILPVRLSHVSAVRVIVQGQYNQYPSKGPLSNFISNNSVDCAMCKNTYHMDCVRPALQKKPARGFAWSCGPCSRKQERKLEARNTPLVGERGVDGEDEELVDEEEEEHGAPSYATSGSSPTNPVADGGIRPATKDQLAIMKAWPVRYLGIHCKPEDVLDYDDRIYPRASSRLGPRHQANVLVWHGHALKYVKPSEIKRKYLKGSGHKKDTKLSKTIIRTMILQILLNYYSDYHS